jgi:hypothetical protein
LRRSKSPQINLPAILQSSMATSTTTGEFLRMQRLRLVIMFGLESGTKQKVSG